MPQPVMESPNENKNTLVHIIIGLVDVATSRDIFAHGLARADEANTALGPVGRPEHAVLFRARLARLALAAKLLPLALAGLELLGGLDLFEFLDGRFFAEGCGVRV